MTTLSQEALFEYVLRMGDNSLVLGHRLSEWCGHGPELEEDIALTNIALDLIGQARLLLSYAGEIEGKGRSEDDLAYLRDELDYKNLLIVERPNQDYAYTTVRQFLYDAFNFEVYSRLVESKDEHLASIAAKALKEITYHRRHSAQWMIRLGDGTELSHEKVQHALDDMWMYTGEMFVMDGVDEVMLEAGVGVDLAAIKSQWDEHVNAVLQEATLTRPEDGWMQGGGKSGRHSEHLGYMLADLQYLQRSHPGATW